jgi:hypothetical protein
MDLNLGYITGSTVEMGYTGAYAGGEQTYPYPAPYGDVDTNSSFYGVVVTETSTYGVVTAFQHFTVDHTAGQAETPPYGNDINDHGTPETGYIGTDFEDRQIKAADGTLSDVYRVNIDIQNASADVIGPVIDSVSVPNAGTYTPGETLTFTVNCNEAAIVTGTPGLNLNIGGSARQANYASGTGTVYLVFDYTVQVGDNDANGIAVTSLSLDDGTIKDEAGNDASLTLNAVGGTSGVLVDGTEAVPVPPTISTALPDLSLNEGDPVDINLGSYFTGAVSYGATGLPAGLTLSGSVISGTAQVGSATVTVTATNTDGSVSDAFGLTVTAIEEAGPIEVQREYSIDAGLSGLPKSQAFIFYQGDRVQITIVHDFDLSDKVLRYRQAEKVGLPARLKLDFSDNVIVFTTEETGLMTASTKVWQVVLRQGDSTVVVAEGKITVKPRIKDE